MVVQNRKHWPKLGDDMAIRQEQRFGYDGVVRGRVTLPNGKPAKGMLIRAAFRHPHLAPGEGFTGTDEDGYYEIHGLAPKEFLIQSQLRGGVRFTPKSRPVDLTATKVVDGIDFTVTFNLDSI